MSCKQYHEMLIARVYEEIDAGDSAELDRHLSQCPACEAELDGLRQTRRILHDAQPTVPKTVPNVLVFAPRRRIHPGLAFAAGVLIGVILLASGVAIGRGMAGGAETGELAGNDLQPADVVTRDELDAALAQYRSQFDEQLTDRDQRLQQMAAVDPITGEVLTRDQLRNELVEFGKVLDLRRNSDLDYLLREIQGVEYRTGSRIGETEQAMRYLVLSSDPRLEEQ